MFCTRTLLHSIDFWLCVFSILGVHKAEAETSSSLLFGHFCSHLLFSLSLNVISLVCVVTRSEEAGTSLKNKSCEWSKNSFLEKVEERDCDHELLLNDRLLLPFICPSSGIKQWVWFILSFWYVEYKRGQIWAKVCLSYPESSASWICCGMEVGVHC